MIFQPGCSRRTSSSHAFAMRHQNRELERPTTLTEISISRCKTTTNRVYQQRTSRHSTASGPASYWGLERVGRLSLVATSPFRVENKWFPVRATASPIRLKLSVFFYRPTALALNHSLVHDACLHQNRRLSRLRLFGPTYGEYFRFVPPYPLVLLAVAVAGA